MIITSPSAGYISSFDFTHIINEDLTLYVSPSGDDIFGDGTKLKPWKTIHKALNWLSDKYINSNAKVTIKCLDGIHQINSNIQPSHPCGHLITLSGETVLSRSITSVQSSSGSSKNFSIVFNLDSVENISVGDYIIISYDASGGTNASYACGCHEITNVDTTNDRITVLSKHYKGAPSGSVTASCKIFKTLLHGNNSSLNVIQLDNGQCLNIENFVVYGSFNYAYRVINNSTLIAVNPVGSSGGSHSLNVSSSGFARVDYCGFSGASSLGVGLTSGNCLAQYAVVSGIGTDTNYRHGFFVSEFSVLHGYHSVSTGNGGDGIECSWNSFAYLNFSTFTGNTRYGWESVWNSVIRKENSTGGNNTSGDTYTQNSGLIHG